MRFVVGSAITVEYSSDRLVKCMLFVVHTFELGISCLDHANGFLPYLKQVLFKIANCL